VVDVVERVAEVSGSGSAAVMVWPPDGFRWCGSGGRYRRTCGSMLDPAADGQGGEHDRQVRFDRVAFAVVDRPACRSCLDIRKLVSISIYGPILDGHMPISYSVDDGLESLLHRYKDFVAQYRWMSAPLASLTHDFLAQHLSCLQNRHGPCTLRRASQPAAVVGNSITSRRRST
jgi:hypothetical protein